MKTWSPRALALVLSLVLATACARQVAVPPGASGSTAQAGQLPFDQVSDGTGISPTGAFASDALPVGTEITIRLQFGLSSADAHAGDSFAAVLDEPLIMAGNTVLRPGAAVTGTVLAANPATPPHDAGFLRLTLASIAVNGKPLPLRTSSIFAKGAWFEQPKGGITSRSETNARAQVSGVNTHSGSLHQTSATAGDGDAKFSTGRRFTFRLAQPLHPPV